MDVAAIANTVATALVGGLVLWEKFFKKTPPTTTTVALLPPPAPPPLALPAPDPAVHGCGAAMAALRAHVDAQCSHIGERIDAIETARAVERVERREDASEDRVARERLSNSLAQLHGKMDALRKGNS